MKIDAHAHIASWPTEKECIKNLLGGMKKYGVDYALVSDCDCSEYLDSGERNPKKLTAVEGAKRVLRLVKKYPSKIGLAIWVNPHFEKVDERLISFIEENREYVHALKIHPYESRLKISSKKIIPYIELAKRFSLPVLFHTAADEYSDIRMLCSLAKQFPDVKFVAAHLQLLSDNQIGIECMKRATNLYCDTAWVPMKNAKKVLLEIGDSRIVYGSDTPIDGLDTYANPLYQDYWRNRYKLKKELYQKLMANNAIDLYSLPIEKEKSH